MNLMDNATGYTSPLNQRIHEEWEKSLQLVNKPIDKEKLNKMIEDLAKSAHAALVQQSISESASDAAASAGRASAANAAYKALAEAAKNQHAAIATEYSARMDQLRREYDLIKRGAATGSPTTNDVVQSAAEGYEKSMTDENYNLPEVQVKSDFGKYLLIGGGVLLAIYLLRGKKKNA